MEKRNFFILIIFASILFLFIGANLDINIYDEGIPLVGAEKILKGELPYVDFWTMYSPGWFYILAFWIALFGKNIILVRLFTIIIISTNIYLFLSILKKLVNNNVVIFILILFLLALHSLTPFYARNVPLALSSILLIVILFASEIHRKELWIGILTGLLFTIRHDFAVYVSLSLLSFWIYQIELQKSKLFKWANVGNFVIAFLLVLFLYFLFLIAFGMLDGFVKQTLLFPIKHFASTRSIPFPNPVKYLVYSNIPFSSKVFKIWEASVFYFPWAMVFFAILMLSKRKNLQTEQKNLIGFLILITLFLSLQGVVRSDYEHIFPSVFFALLLFGGVFDRVFLSKKFVVLFCVLIFLLLPLAKKVSQLYILLNPKKTVELASPHSKWIRLRLENSYYNDLLAYILNNCEEPSIFSGLVRHDKIYINDVMLYYLMDKRPPTKFYELHPGVATDFKVQKQIIQELEKENVKCLVLFLNDVFEEQKYIGSNYLDEHIRENFVFVRSFGKYSVWQKKQ